MTSSQNTELHSTPQPSAQLLVDSHSKNRLPAQGIPCSLTQDLSVEFPSEVLDQFFQYDLDQEFKIKMTGLVNNRYVA